MWISKTASDASAQHAFKAVAPKLVRAVTQMKIGIMSYYPQYFAVIAHKTEQRGFGSAVTPEESHVTPAGLFTPTLGTTALGQ